MGIRNWPKVSLLERSLLRSTVSQSMWYARKEHSAFYGMVTPLKESNISHDLSNSDTYWALQMAFYNDSIIFWNSWSLETWCNIVCYCKVFDGIKEVSFDGVHYLQYFHLQTAYHFRGFLEVTNWEAIFTLKQMLYKLVSRRIFILHDNNLITVLQTKRLEYLSSPVCHRW